MLGGVCGVDLVVGFGFVFASVVGVEVEVDEEEDGGSLFCRLGLVEGLLLGTMVRRLPAGRPVRRRDVVFIFGGGSGVVVVCGVRWLVGVDC